MAVDNARASLLDVFSGSIATIRVDNVVIRAHGRPVDGLYHALRGTGPEVMRVGDAVAVRLADRAIFEGHLAGRAIQ